MSQRQPGAGVVQHHGQAGRRTERIERDVAAAGPQRAEDGDDGVHRARQQDGDALAVLQALGLQAAGQRSRAVQQLA
ncbi:hypothetical protein AA0N74_20710, partial [Chromobacterium vaccinii]